MAWSDPRDVRAAAEFYADSQAFLYHGYSPPGVKTPFTTALADWYVRVVEDLFASLTDHERVVVTSWVIRWNKFVTDWSSLPQNARDEIRELWLRRISRDAEIDHVLSEGRKRTATQQTREQAAVAEWNRTHPTAGQTIAADTRANFKRQIDTLTGRSP